MKIKKCLVPISLLSLLTACSSQGYAGTYTFQLGKTKDTHMGITLELSKELYDASYPEGGNKFTLTTDMSSQASETSMFSLLEEFNPIEGSYKVDKNKKIYGGASLNLSINLLGEYNIPASITDYLFVANIKNNTATFYIPVSLEDLTFQLYWYGFDFSIEKFLNGEEEDILFAAEDGSHPLASHPSKEDVDKINEHYKDSHDGVSFRDYHVLELGLSKN